MELIVTGAAGYIGGSFVHEALSRDYKVVGIDNLINSNKFNIEKIINIKNDNFSFYEVDLKESQIHNILEKENLSSPVVVHFASLKSVYDSTVDPILYWENNLISAFNLAKAMQVCGFNKFVFSSSASVYSESNQQPVNENDIVKPSSPYAFTKLSIENFLNNISDYLKFDVLNLRYFNPIGTHKDFMIHDIPNKNANNLMPKIVRTAIGIDKKLKVFGDDYKTIDGTGIRDYIHISDLVDGHFKAIDYIREFKGNDVINLGTGKGYSVLELINEFEKVNNISVPYEIVSRRDGDVEVSIANVKKAKSLLDWSAKKGLKEMCSDSAKIINSINIIESIK